MLLHGGDDRSVVTFGDTWEWNGTDWIRRLPDEVGVIEPAMAAFPREGHAVRIDNVGATRVWESGAWSIRVAAGSGAPTARAGHAGAADIAGRRILIHGGAAFSAGQIFGDTWLFDGSVWRQITTPGPPPRFNAAMTYDQARGEFVLFGGEAGVSTNRTALGPFLGLTFGPAI